MILEKKEAASAVKQTVESAKPRKHIEIEKKFYCAEKQLEKAKQYLDEQYKDAEKFEKEQIDTYFDCRADAVWILASRHFGFRCRKRDGNYIFTVKIPTDSPNYHSSFQFARHEYELQTAEQHITDEVWQFLIDTLDVCEKGDLCEQLSRDQLKAQLVVRNRRVTYRLEGKCEICLDTVDYMTADLKSVGTQDYQIEIELLDEPEAWAELERAVITPLVQELGTDPLDYTNKSKLEKGLELLQMKEEGIIIE